MLGSFWHHAGTNEIHPKCCGADFGSRIKISGNLLGQNDQNFDIYPFDWSQVASWGLAAEGEALTILKLGSGRELIYENAVSAGPLVGPPGCEAR